MTFVLKKLSDHGTSNPIVARLAVQTHEVIRFFSLPKEKQDRLLEIYINMVKPRLLQCMELSDNIVRENEEMKAHQREPNTDSVQWASRRGTSDFSPYRAGGGISL